MPSSTRDDRFSRGRAARLNRGLVVAVVAVALLCSGCGSSGDGGSEKPTDMKPTSRAAESLATIQAWASEGHVKTLGPLEYPLHKGRKEGALKGVTPAIEQLIQLGEGGVDAAVSLTNTPDPIQRSLGVYILGARLLEATKRERVVLRRLLSDDDSDVRVQAALALISVLSEPEEKAAVLRTILSSPSEYRLGALRAALEVAEFIDGGAAWLGADILRILRAAEERTLWPRMSGAERSIYELALRVASTLRIDAPLLVAELQSKVLANGDIDSAVLLAKFSPPGITQLALNLLGRESCEHARAGVIITHYLETPAAGTGVAFLKLLENEEFPTALRKGVPGGYLRVAGSGKGALRLLLAAIESSPLDHYTAVAVCLGRERTRQVEIRKSLRTLSSDPDSDVAQAAGEVAQRLADLDGR